MIKVFNTKIGQIECSITTDTDNYNRAEFAQTSVIFNGKEYMLSCKCRYFSIPILTDKINRLDIKLLQETFKFSNNYYVDELEMLNSLEEELNKKINSKYINQYELGR